MRRKLLILFSFLISLPVAQGAALNSKDGKTEFLAVVKPSGIRINGSGAAPTGNVEFNKEASGIFLSGTVEVDLNSLDTGMSLRNSHMKEKYLQTDKFPKALLVFERWPVSKDLLEKGGEVAGEGELQLHGEKRKLPIQIKLESKDDIVVAKSQFKVLLSQFEIEQPKFAKLVVSDEIEISTVSSLNKKELGIE